MPAPANQNSRLDDSGQDILEIDQAPTPSRLTQKPHQPVIATERNTKKSEIFSARSLKGKVRSRDRYKKYGAPDQYDESSPTYSAHDHGVDDSMNPLDRESLEQRHGASSFIPGNSP